MRPAVLLLGILSLGGCRQSIIFRDAPSALSCDTIWYGDADGDGYGGDTFELAACEQPEGYVDNSDDCDDLEPNRNPSVPEVCGDGLDNDCNGEAEDQCLTLIEDGTAYYGTTTAEGGFTLAVGDVNGDGIEDILLGTPNATVSSTFDGGAALFFGPHDEDLALEEADVRIQGEPDGKHVLGYMVDIPGDVDGDGLDDVVLTGTQLWDLEGTSTGGVVHFSASTLLSAAATDEPLTAYDGDDIWFGLEKRDYLGSGLSSANLDGAVTLFAGASGVGDSQGAIYQLAADGTLVTEIVGEATDDLIGLGDVVAGGDFNGDGIADVITGAPMRGSDDGELYACFAPFPDTMSIGDCIHVYAEGSGNQLGDRVSPAGDVDGDGLEDVWVAASSFDGVYIEEGAAYLLTGRSDPSVLDGQSIEDVALARLAGVDSNDQVGSALARGADLDGDGHADTVISAAQVGQIEQGAALLFYGPLAGNILAGTADVIYTSQGETDRAGEALAILPQLGGILIDTPESDYATTNGGTTWLVTLD